MLNLLVDSVAAALMVSLLAFLSRNLIIERLKNSVEHEYNAKLEGLRLSHQRILDKLHEERKERESLRSHALSAISAAQGALLNKRLSGVETIWKAFHSLRDAVPHYIYLVDMLGYDTKKFGPKLHENLSSAEVPIVLQSSIPRHKEVVTARPFLSKSLYALYYAAQMCAGRATSSTIMSYQRKDLRPWFEDSEVDQLMQSLLTEDELATFRSKQRHVLLWLLNALEEKLIVAIDEFLSGRHAAALSIDEAHWIIEAARALETDPSPEPKPTKTPPS